MPDNNSEPTPKRRIPILSGFDARMKAKKAREDQAAAEEAQAKITPHILDVNGVRVCCGEMPQIAHAMHAKRAMKMVIEFNENGPDTYDTWRAIFQAGTKAKALPDVVEVVFHIKCPPTHAKSMHGKPHLERPALPILIENMLEGITAGVPEAISVVQSFKRWTQQSAKVELILAWL